ncbi:hypothetical protein MARINOS108_20258 [Marinoscillum sp. 108]|nr:hypothetical protein MARINOS108_20258 [Marinoscillum sp. 108]
MGEILVKSEFIELFLHFKLITNIEREKDKFINGSLLDSGGVTTPLIIKNKIHV